jgi:hypothetical protein
MGDDILYENDSACPCGKGTVHVEIYEHDTWPSSGRHKRWWLKCTDCDANYVKHPSHHDCLISKKDADELEQRHKVVGNRRKTVEDLALQRYLPQFRDHIKSLKFKTAMHSALGEYGGIARFRKETDTPEKLDRVIEERFRWRLRDALAEINVVDALIMSELEAVERDAAAVSDFESKIVRFTLPKAEYFET